jgi:anaerobic ribonucleoside-triphosphate reductase
MRDGGEKACPERVKAVRAEVYSRVVGYYRPVQDWNRGKQEEFADRKYVDLKEAESGKKGD